MTVVNFLREEGFIVAVEMLVASTKAEISSRMVQTINENSTNQQIPGAAAVYSLVEDGLASLVRWDIEIAAALPTIGEPNIFYLVPESQGVYSVNIFFNGEWKRLGDTEIDLTDYWRKDELVAMSNTRVQEIIDGVLVG
jgi:hypothetical protein